MSLKHNSDDNSEDRLYFSDQYSSGLPRDLVSLHMSPNEVLLQKYYGDDLDQDLFCLFKKGIGMACH